MVNMMDVVAMVRDRISLTVQCRTRSHRADARRDIRTTTSDLVIIGKACHRITVKRIHARRWDGSLVALASGASSLRPGADAIASTNGQRTRGDGRHLSRQRRMPAPAAQIYGT